MSLTPSLSSYFGEGNLSFPYLLKDQIYENQCAMGEVFQTSKAGCLWAQSGPKHAPLTLTSSQQAGPRLCSVF